MTNADGLPSNRASVLDSRIVGRITAVIQGVVKNESDKIKRKGERRMAKKLIALILSVMLVMSLQTAKP